MHAVAVELDLVQPLVAFGAALASCVSRGATNAGNVSGLLRRRELWHTAWGKKAQFIEPRLCVFDLYRRQAGTADVSLGVVARSL
jgi:hypothetical protein